MSPNTKNYHEQGGDVWVVDGTLRLHGFNIASVKGDSYYVDSNTGSDTDDGLTWDTALATLNTAFGKCTANNGDVVFVAPGHAEDVVSAGAIACSKAGITVICLGSGADRPTFTFKTVVGADFDITGASFKMVNFIGKAGLDGLTNPLHVAAADCFLDFEWQDGSATVEALRAVLTTASADRFKANIKYRGFTAGDACVNAVRLVGVDTAEINIDAYGKASTCWVEFHTTACTNVKVNGILHNSGTTDGSKNVIATVTGSTWWADIFDFAAGSRYTGGSAASIASDDISSITAALYGTDGIVTWPSPAAPGNGVSLAEAVRYIADALLGATGIAAFPAGAAAANDVSLAEVIRYIQENIIRGAGTALPDAQSLYDLLAGANGIAAWPVAAAPGNGVSLAEAIRYIVETQVGTLTNTGGTATLGGILGDLANISAASRLDSGTKKTTIADGTTIPNNAQAVAGLLATATGGDVLIEEIIWQRGADNFVGPTNYEFSTDNIAGLTGAAAPNGVALLVKFNAQKTGILSIDGATKQVPFVLESGKKLYIHGDDAATSAGGTTDFYIRYRRLAAGAYLA